MVAPPPEAQWIANPDLVTAAIKLLAGVVVLLGSALIGTLLYIWHSHKKDVADIVTKIETKVDKFAKSLESLATNVEHRLTSIETTCKERECRIPRSTP